MKKSILMILIVTMAVAFAGCGAKNQAGSPEASPKLQSVKKPELTRETYPRVDGAAETKALSGAVVSELLGISAEEAEQMTVHSTNRTAMENLVIGKCDLIFVAQPTAEELKIAQDAGVELEVIPVAKEGLVFVTSAKNAIKSLRARQVQGVYQGTITNWSSFGGQNVNMVAYQREKGSASQALLAQTAMKDLEPQAAGKTFQDRQELAELLAKDKGLDGILGYMTYQEAKDLKEDSGIKILDIDSISPSPASIADGQYPLTSSYCAVYKKTDTAKAASRLVASWLAGAEGQQLIEKSGYVPLITAQ